MGLIFRLLQRFSLNRIKTSEDKLGDVFMGYHADTCASIILLVSQKFTDVDLKDMETEVKEKVKDGNVVRKFLDWTCIKVWFYVIFYTGTEGS